MFFLSSFKLITFNYWNKSLNKVKYGRFVVNFFVSCSRVVEVNFVHKIFIMYNLIFPHKGYKIQGGFQTVLRGRVPLYFI